MLWFKAFHIILVIFWMAGLLYLYRLFAYHAAETEAVVKQRFGLMEKRLYFYITLPAGIAAVATGVRILLYMPQYYFTQGWFHAKLTFGIILFLQTLWGWRLYSRFQKGEKLPSATLMRVFNEGTTLLIVLIVLLAVLEPH